MTELPQDPADTQLTELADRVPLAPELAGNVPDPDAATLDNLVEQDAVPPTPEELPKAEREPQNKPFRPSRLFGQTETLLKDWGPTLILPADESRQGLRIRVTGTADENVRIADSMNAVQSLRTCATFVVGDDTLIVPAHTGPIWAYAPDVAASITVSILSVNK